MPGQLYYEGEVVYTFTQADRDLLVRAVFGEEGADACAPGKRGGLAVACTMLQRWAMFLTLPWYRRLLRRKPEARVYGYDSFDDLLHAYSQPVNFAWLNGGKFDKDPSVVDDREKRRADILERPLDSFPLDIRDMADDVLCFPPDGAASRATLMYGVPADMAGLVHFYSPVYYYARKLKKRPSKLSIDEVMFACRTAFGSDPSGRKIFSQPDGVDPRANAFYRIPRTIKWLPSTVQVVPRAA